ncbi:MAG: phosphocholine cytidylyltransferase family protein [Flavobacteriales bacterium]|nr:phosphocholine cytidylyltransferase family protein [Flavobacteriales bacterium]
MKAIILAAGSGTRLKKYTQELPKGMLEVFGKPILQHQVDTYRRNGVQDISIISGFHAEKIDIPGTRKYFNPMYASTNMVESLFCASEQINGDVIISYADILFEDNVLRKTIQSIADIGVVVDSSWQDYWHKRYGRIDFDTESLRINSENNITEIGQEAPPVKEIDGRYVGIIRLSPIGSDIFKKTYFDGKANYSGKTWLNNRAFENVYMTDFLQAIINNLHLVKPIWTEKGWLEFDTNEDYEQIIELDRQGVLSQFYNHTT